MELEKAMTIISAACAGYKGNLEEHRQIQLAIQAIGLALKPKPEGEKGHDNKVNEG